ncbi:S8 family serine peptidase [Streptomyces sp. NPDC050610]|uniref:S8 family serine peptidase n=1 Tax=Streptomyces sp. NPDC050610 TaxID=3157097 RepID=UPI0034380B68
MRFQIQRLRRRVLSATALCGVGLVSLGGLGPAAAAADIRSKQWYLQDMQADNMWKVSKGEGVTVAVIDSGVDAQLPELGGQVLAGADFTKSPAGAHKDSNGHGTNMAALIAGTGKEGGIQGLAPEAKILPVKVTVNQKTEIVDQMLAKAMRYAVDHDARVINVSLAPVGPPSYFTKFKAAVDYAMGKGSLVVAGVGNSGDKENLPAYPSSFPGVLGIGAMDRRGEVTKWSNHGDQVGLVAFGDELPEHCTKSEGICMAGGTSQATAITSASAALIRSKHPEWSPNQVLRVMMETAGKPAKAKLPSKYLGYGSIRPRKVLVDGEGNPGPADVNPLLAANQKSTASGSPTPAPSSGKSTEGGQGETKTDSAASAESKSSSTGGNTVLWTVVGVAAVVLLGGLAVFMRRRAR